MQFVDCLYRMFGGYANWNERFWYNCSECKRDELNMNCKYYYPVQLTIIEVNPNDNRMRKK